MIPTDKAAIEGLLTALDRITREPEPLLHQLQRIKDDIESGNIIIEDGAYKRIMEFLPLVVDIAPALQRLLAGETREADKPAGVPDAIKGYEQYPFAWHFGNIKVVLETMECTGKLPNGCPNCKGLDFCTKRDALKRYAQMEKCWNFWMEDPHHG